MDDGDQRKAQGIRYHHGLVSLRPLGIFKPLIGEILRFCKRQWFMLPAVIPALVLFTLFHEAAHAVAVLLQGGRIVEFVWLPTGGLWGHISYDFGDESYSAVAIAAAPYVMWLTASTSAAVLSLSRYKFPFVLASFIFVWLYVAPAADIANTAFPYVLGSRNDFFSVFSGPSPALTTTLAVCCLAYVAAGFFVQRRLYRQDALSGKAYLALAASTLLLLGIFWAI